MKTLRKLWIVVLLLAGVSVQAESRDYKFSAPQVDVTVRFYAPGIVRVTKVPTGKVLERPSMVVIAQPEEVEVSVKGKRTLSSSALRISVDENSGCVTFRTAGGKLLLREIKTDFIERMSGPDKGAYRVTQTFLLDKNEPVYGLGTVQDGKMNRRGTSILMEQSNIQDYQNVLQSIKGWGLFWDNYSRTQFSDNEEGMTFSSEVGDGIDYYFMYGGSADGVIAQMRQLSGQVPMFPLWTYGYWQSKERYKTEGELYGVVEKYRQLQVPLDGIIQDWQYWGSNYTWNAMEFISEHFTNAKRTIERIHERNAHVMISIWASFGPMTKPYRQLAEKDLLYDFETWPQSGLSPWPPRMDYPSGVRVYDAFSPEARDIYWQNLKRLYDYDIDAWWMDSTDPDFFNPKEEDYDHKAGNGTWRSLRNAFPLASVSGVYENQRKVGEDKRVFIMTRSAFAGQQRYGSNMWSGDVNSSWDMLRKQIPAGLSFSLTGNPNFNTDIGGFFCGAYNTGGNMAAQNIQYQELYVRWMQYGLFCPVFRSHGADAPREIYQFGKKGDAAYDAIEKMIRLRYRLLPYLYSTAWQVTSAQESYLRPLFSDFAGDPKVWEMTDEFMFGRSILAAPIVEAQYTKEVIVKGDAMSGWDKQKAVASQSAEEVDFSQSRQTSKYLPKGTRWYDFWTNKVYRGGQTVTLETAFDRVPMFVRAGSILPLGPEMQYVGEKSWDNLEMRVYPGADGSFTLYEDEGDNYNYEKGVYSTVEFTWDDSRRELTVGDRKGEYPGMLMKRTFTVVLPDGTSQLVEYDGKRKEIRF